MDLRTEPLTPEVKRWLGVAILAIVLADGKISSEERAMLQDVKLLVTQAEQDDILRQLRNGTLRMANLKVDRTTAFKLLEHLLMVATQDKELAEREIEFLNVIIERLGFPARMSPMVIELAQAMITLEGKRKQLMTLALNSPPSYRG